MRKTSREQESVLRRLDDFVKSMSNAELTVGFIHMVQEMVDRGLSTDAQSVIGNVQLKTQTVKVANLDFIRNDPFVLQVRKAIQAIKRKSRRCGDFMDVFQGREKQRISNKEFIQRFAHLKDPSRATASTRCQVNDLLAELEMDLYVHTETIDRGLGHTYKTEYWLGPRPR